MKSLVIDSGSTSDIIANVDILNNVHEATSPLKVNTINGLSKISRQANMGDYPLPVWYNPSGGVNILSLHNVQDHYRCTMDTKKENSINVHLNDGSLMKFKSSGKGLYVYEFGDEESMEEDSR